MLTAQALDGQMARGAENRQPAEARVPVAFVVAMLAADALAATYLYASNEHEVLLEANAIISIVLLIVCALGGVITFLRSPLAVWTPLPWFLSICSVYYGFGPLLFAFGSAASIRYAESYYPVDQVDLARTNILNAVSIAIVCATYSVFQRFFRSSGSPRVGDSSSANVRLLVVLAATAVPIKYGLLLPWTFGLLSGAPPSSIASFGYASLIVTLLLWYEGLGTRRRLIWVAVPFTLTEIITSAFTFSKEMVLLTMLMFLLSLFLRYPKRRVLLAGGVGLIAVYMASVPLVTNARFFFSESSSGDLAARVDSGVRAMSGSTTTNLLQPDTQAWWLRVSYANAQAYALTAYDVGQPGHTFENAAFTFIPRFLWPDKPITSPGTDFNKLVVGYDTSASGPGVFAEAYWNGGWGAVVVVCSLLGLLFAWAGHMAIKYMSRGDLRWLVCGLFMILMGLRPDDWFILAFVTPFLVFVAYFVAIRLLVPDPPLAAGRS